MTGEPPRRRVCVAGSINIDISVRVAHHPLPGESLLGRSIEFLPGGKGANQALAAARLGVSVSLLGALGTDHFGDELAAYLVSEGLDMQWIKRVSAASGTALIAVSDAGENTVIVAPGANLALEATDSERLPLEVGDVVLSQFEIQDEAIEALFRRARQVGALTILNAAPARALSEPLRELVDLLVVNETELSTLGKQAPGSDLDAVSAAACELGARFTQGIVVTLGALGALACLQGQVLYVPGRVVKVVDSTGAGDCFVGALAARLAHSEPIQQALIYANTAASLCVGRRGAAPSLPTAAEVEALLST